MKSTIFVHMLGALIVFGSITVPAQTLKWSYTADGASEWSTDGHGALAVVYRSSDTNLGAVTWIDSAGRLVLSNAIADLGVDRDNSDIRIVRFNATELAVQVEASYEHLPATNFLRRIRHNGTFTDTVLPIGERMDALPSKLLDNRGFFTRESIEGSSGFIFRRYTN